MNPTEIFAAKAIGLFVMVFGGGFVVGYNFCLNSLKDAVRFMRTIDVDGDANSSDASRSEQ